MQNWQKIYHDRLRTPEEAVKAIKSGDRVVIAHACGEAQVLSKAMVARANELQNVEIVHMVAMGKAEYCLPEMAGHFRHNSLFVGATTRQAVNEGRADYTPCFFSEIPRLFKKGYLPVDVAIVQVSPPDRFGFCSLGISVDYTKPAAECAGVVIAQVNKNMPRTMGDSFMHVSQFDSIVEYDEPLIELPKAKITEVEARIGEYVVQLVEDEATLQLGIGAIPDAVMLFLKGKKDLGIHTEMFSDGVVELYEDGVITCQAKTIHRGKMVATFLMGTKKLYDFVNDNPIVEMFPVDYVNDPYIISQNKKMTAINSALQVDLLGQVCADTLGTKQYSGVGGQVDFVRGAARSDGGKSIIALPSTAGKGKFSRIVAELDKGAAVTTSRNEVHYVVTEYGIADLRGKTLRQRAKELISIAHPDFREKLLFEAKSRNLV
ncbi:4-hydroxybutyrate CoA-transferase [Desulfofundulus thermobenzoicus]|uniref:4-hydroxybutyrate CoA-transferase n=1 Tax=Desulfofundulus thermobenzoicus TaxID=29376 RepID=A0A6N7IVF7_9FIRM|nr:acetyl-CoA hydrolase/transferase C-terminal domain-containing protein [Desulfofundulus thermobenzoicus]MQL53427.1 4-hydroxybutyrate CoA-transferase [Desulfofundulus thermobenzoicus]